MPKPQHAATGPLLMGLCWIAWSPACQSAAPERTSVTQRLDEPATAVDTPRNGPAQDAPKPIPAPHAGPVVAVVNGRGLPADHFDDLLVRSHGLFVLEQLISLSLVEAELDRRGLIVTREEIDDELDRSLIEIGGRVAKDDPQALRLLGERLLTEVLRDKNVSRTEFMNGMRRNAGLRKLTRDDVVVEENEVLVEFMRLYGRKAVVRHIEVPMPAIAAEVRRQLADGGAFSELAVRYSANPASAGSGGLIAPFTRDDPEVPALMRSVAFQLQPGETSSTVLIDGKHHLFRLERLIEPEHMVMTPALAAPIREQLRERKSRDFMQAVEGRLFEKARIQVEDPRLEELFREKYPEKY